MNQVHVVKVLWSRDVPGGEIRAELLEAEDQEGVHRLFIDIRRFVQDGNLLRPSQTEGVRLVIGDFFKIGRVAGKTINARRQGTQLSLIEADV